MNEFSPTTSTASVEETVLNEKMLKDAYNTLKSAKSPNPVVRIRGGEEEIEALTKQLVERGSVRAIVNLNSIFGLEVIAMPFYPKGVIDLIDSKGNLVKRFNI